MDLPTYAETEGADVPLPFEVDDVAQVIGRAAAVKLAIADRDWHYVPQRAREGHPLAVIIGVDAARALGVTHSRMVIGLPDPAELRAAHAAYLAAAA